MPCLEAVDLTVALKARPDINLVLLEPGQEEERITKVWLRQG